MKSFKLNEEFQVVCEFVKTRQVYDRRLCKSIPVKCLKKFTHKDFTFFIHRALENDHFVCSEAESGAAVCRGVTKKGELVTDINRFRFAKELGEL